MSGQFRHDVEGQRAQQYMINCTDLDPKDTIIYWANRTYSQTGFQVQIWEHIINENIFLSLFFVYFVTSYLKVKYNKLNFKITTVKSPYF